MPSPLTLLSTSLAAFLLSFTFTVFQNHNPHLIDDIYNSSYSIIGSSSESNSKSNSNSNNNNNNNKNIKTFTLHPNGDGTGPGITLKLSDFSHVDQVISKHCCQLMNKAYPTTELDPSIRCAPNSGARLITNGGLRVMTLPDDIEYNNQRIYCVPQGLHFVWPSVGVGHVVKPKNVRNPIPAHPIRLRQLSLKPLVFAVENFVSPDEVEELLRSNRHRLEPSEVGFAGWRDATRTSWTSWDHTSDASKAIHRRTFQILAMDIDLDMADPVQILRYTPNGYEGQGEWYKPHVDWFASDGYDGSIPNVNNGTNRFATMFLYLSNVEEGGHTVFPLSTSHEGYNGERLVSEGTENIAGYINTEEARWCCNTSSTALRSEPRSGNAVLFYSQTPTGELDKFSLHGGCPPIKGEKWSGNVWVWNRPKADKAKAKDGPPNKNNEQTTSEKKKRSNKKKKQGDDNDNNQTDDDKMMVDVQNIGSQSVDVYWHKSSPNVDENENFHETYQSQPSTYSHMFKVKAGDVISMNTFMNHFFVVVKNKSVISTFKVTEDGEVIKIGGGGE
jgi:hypothetical protein